MTERINVNAAQNDGGPHMPSWMDEDAVTYAQAGVDTAEGARAVEAIKGVVHDTYRPRWWATSAASAACSPSRRPRTWPIRCWSAAPTAWARS